MLKKDRRSINNKYLKKQIILVAIIIIYILSLSFISGRYVIKRINTYLASSKEFYFYSDKLKEKDENGDYVVIWSGTEECIIPINLYTKMNSLKQSEYKIAYKVLLDEVSEGIECRLQNGKTVGIVDPQEGNTDVVTLLINANKEVQIGDIFKVKVSIETTDVTTEEGEVIESYTKTLGRTFEIKVVDSNQIKCKIEDKSGRAYLNFIANASTSNSITLNFNDDELILDNTNNVLKKDNIFFDEDSDGYIDKIIISADATIKFFKKQGRDFYTTSDIVSEGNNVFRIIEKDVN